MQRRSFLQSMAAALMAPTIRLRDTVVDERLLMPFCEPEPDWYRYDFEKPFGIGSLTYASDSKALIRCELAARDEDGERKLPKNLLSVWNHHWRPTEQWRPLTPDDLRPTERVTGRCPYCGDRRKSFGPNYPDDQETADALLDWDVDDNTIRDSSCEHCHGRDYTGPSCVRINGVVHQSWTMRRILALPNPQVCGTKADRFGVLLFRAEGFEGISMGMGD